MRCHWLTRDWHPNCSPKFPRRLEHRKPTKSRSFMSQWYASAPPRTHYTIGNTILKEHLITDCERYEVLPLTICKSSINTAPLLLFITAFRKILSTFKNSHQLNPSILLTLFTPSRLQPRKITFFLLNVLYHLCQQVVEC
jgi:hypothetical protein